jgi:putative SOS response-associated peptidase YedK
MCGRFVRSVSIEDIADEFEVDKPAFDLSPSYNIAPSQDIAIIMNGKKRSMTLCRWGLIPSWAKDPKIGYKMINARTETVAEKPSFRSSFKKHRILVPANGFYEWKKDGKSKVPFYISLKSGKPFGFAGLISMWTTPEKKQICTCTIITTSANDRLHEIHDRMPVIIHKTDEDRWLDPAEQDKDTLLSLLKTYPSGKMDYYAVSPMVNSPSNNSPDCLNRI